ncbi:hypothetical protein GF339_16295 [candidate division KSB3 bacterium]|uniref:Right handed beta helix domain-containing protein n=1 Tax=candidate division KSB3 bacterium TaxID=2044937 RepID=A0A9D5JXT9_9BACT|nr:hypothetical protein [candidate division KSB3 bacterium]MBD3326148.1 hypothetical protein [candidate division KSB3 bacterium]
MSLLIVGAAKVIIKPVRWSMNRRVHSTTRMFIVGTVIVLCIMPLISCSDSSTEPQTTLLDFQDSSACLPVPLPMPSGASITVSTVAELIQAVQQANATGQVTIFLEDGTYTLQDMLWISGNNVTFRSHSGNRDAVILRGQGMSGGVSHIFNVAGSDFTAADMTLGWVANHGVQIHSDSDNPLIQNVRFVDTGEQMLKVSYRPGDSTSSDNGRVQWCLFEYSAGVGPQYYIGGVDAHQAHNWVVRSNIFRHIRSPGGGLAEHAIHFWSESSNTLVENNIIVNCDRGIGFGMGDRGHRGGMIRNNMVYTTRDVGIGLENASNTQVYNNTLYTENYGNSIEYRFPGTRGVEIINNLSNASITNRDGGSGRIETNVTNAQNSWFVDVRSGDLHLRSPEPSVIDQGQALGQISQDIDCEIRPQGAGYDIGADEKN